MSSWKNNNEIEILCKYLRIASVHPNVDYEPCVQFLKEQALQLDLPVSIYHPTLPNKPVVLITWTGTEPDLQSVLLNSHMDVVPVFPEKWSYPPFAAEMDKEGRIYARGIQDMKSVGMQYLAAIRALKRDDITVKRTIHVLFVPDEEIGGSLGMKEFVESVHFKRMNVGFAMDEGIATPDNIYPVFYAERSIWHVYFRITGNAGHGSLLLKNTAGQKLYYILDKMMQLRAESSSMLEHGDKNMTTGDVITVNLTKASGGIQSNVIPAEMEICFDIRLPISVDHKEFEDQMHKWCEEAGGDIEIVFEQKQPKVQATSVDDSNKYWLAFKKACDEMDIKITPMVFPGGTDSRYLREKSIPAIGFSPINNTPVLLHDHDEFIKADTYMKGIDIYKKLIQAVTSV